METVIKLREGLTRSMNLEKVHIVAVSCALCLKGLMRDI